MENTNNTNTDDFYYEYNDERSIYQPLLFDFVAEEDLEPETYSEAK